MAWPVKVWLSLIVCASSCLRLVESTELNSALRKDDLEWRFNPGLCMIFAPDKNTSSANTDSCQNICEEETAFDCKAFSYNDSGNICLLWAWTSLHLQTIPCTEGFDGTFELKDVEIWNSKLGCCLNQNNDKFLPDVSLSTCQSVCEEEKDFRCLSVKYDPITRDCNISREDSKTTWLFCPCNEGPYDMYERNLWPAFQHRPGQCMEGDPGRVFYDLYPRDCLATCALEIDFDCLAVNYNTVNRSCQLFDRAKSQSDIEQCSNGMVDYYGTVERRIWDRTEDACVIGSRFYVTEELTVHGCLEFCEISYPQSCHSIQFRAVPGNPYCVLGTSGRPFANPCIGPDITSATHDVYESMPFYLCN